MDLEAGICGWESTSLKMNQPKGAVVFIILCLKIFFEKEQTVSNFKVSVNFTKKHLEFTGLQGFFTKIHGKTNLAKNIKY